MPADPILGALIDAVSADYEVFGELGRHPDGAVAFLARSFATQALVALVLTPGAAGAEEEYSLDVLEKLDTRVPEAAQQCSQCQTILRAWARFCVRCGHDASGLAASGALGPDELRALAERVAGDNYDLLGEMPRAGGGGAVYFGRHRRTGKVSALRLEISGGEKVGVSTMQTLKTMESPVRERPVADTGSNRPAPRISVVMNTATLGKAGESEPVLATRTKPRHTLTGTEPSLELTIEEALGVLGLDGAADEGEKRRRYQDLYSEYRVRETNAPTASLRLKYRSSLASIEAAGRALGVG